VSVLRVLAFDEVREGIKLMQQRIVVRHEWAKGSRIKADIDRTARQFESLLKRDGAIKLEAVIEESQPEHAPLHDDFEWQDDVAAHLYRMDQAGGIVRSFRRIVVNMQTEDEEPAERVYVPTRMVVSHDESETKPEANAYVQIPIAQTDEDQKEQIVTQAIDRVDRLVREFQSIPALSDLAGELSDLLMKYR
jgi:hypothetical protein